jgi:outer membrane protein assembly factor BamB
VGITNDGLTNKALYAAVRSKGAALLCLDPLTGELLWQFGMASHGGAYGVVTPPTRQGDRIYFKSGLDVVCLDADGLADGNDGVTNETEIMLDKNWKGEIEGEPMKELAPDVADIIWISSIKDMLGVQTHDSSCGTPLIIDDQVWVPTSNCAGIKPATAHFDREKFERMQEEGKIKPGRGGPNLIVLDKNTGRLLAADPLKIPRIFHGQWSSPSTGVVNGRRVVFWGDGYGFLHAFAVPERADGQAVQELEVVWSLDCNPPRCRFDDEGNELPYPFHGEARNFALPGVGIGPGEVIATPVFPDGRVYIAIGRDRAYSKQDPATYNGALTCIDPGVVEGGAPKIVWRTEKLHRTQSTVSIVDGLVYVADMGGLMNCFEQETGEKVWEYDLGYMVECRSQFVADGKIYIGTDRKRDFFVFRCGREPVVLSQTKTKDAIATPGAVDGILYIGHRRSLTAYYGPGYDGPKPDVQVVDEDSNETEKNEEVE